MKRRGFTGGILPKIETIYGQGDGMGGVCVYHPVGGLYTSERCRFFFVFTAVSNLWHLYCIVDDTTS